MHRFALTVLPLLLIACSEDPARPDPDASPGSDAKADTGQGSDAQADAPATGKAEMVISDDLLTVLELRFLKGRCLGRMSINSKDSAARTAIVAFAKAVMLRRWRHSKAFSAESRSSASAPRPRSHTIWIRRQ